MWLAPVQVVVIPIGDTVEPYARHVTQALGQRGLRVHLDGRNETMQAKVRDAQLQKVPYMGIVGSREASANTVAVRHRRDGDLGVMPVEQFADRVMEENLSRRLT